jgi:nitrogenase molybdenum-iron protein beta chain
MTGHDRDSSSRHWSHTRLFGVHLATHAIPDAACFLHGGEGCKTKSQLHLVFNDWMHESHNRRIWTDIDDTGLIRGSALRLEQMIRTWVPRRKPAIAFVAAATFLELAGDDLDGAVKRAAAEVGCPVHRIVVSAFDGDLLDGYRQVIDRCLREVTWDRAPESGINVVGHFFDRYEADREADLHELERLAGGLGLPVRSVFLSGSPFAQLQEAWRASVNVVLPDAAPLAAELSRLAGRPTVVTDLPVGLHGTARWLRSVGEAARIDSSRVEAFIDTEMARAVPRIHCLVERIGEVDARRTFALFSHSSLAAALCAWLTDMELVPAVVGLLDQGREEFFRQSLGRACPTEVPDFRLLASPSRREIRQTLAALPRTPDLLLGSSVEVTDLADLGIPSLEVGFPSFARHGLFPMPTVGFNGALALAQRVLDALSRVH